MESLYRKELFIGGGMNRLRLTLMLLILPLTAFAFDPYTYLNYLENAKIATHSVTALQYQMRQIQNQLHMIQLEVANAKRVSDYRWNNITSLVQQIDQLTQQGQSISYAMQDVDQRFRQQYPDYGRASAEPADYVSVNQGWQSSTLNTLYQSLQSLHANAAHFSDEQLLMKHLKIQGASTQGRLQSLQVLSQIAAENVNQLQTLKRSLMAQANGEEAYMAYQVSKNAYEARALQALDQHIKQDFPAYRDEEKFGFIPHF